MRVGVEKSVFEKLFQICANKQAIDFSGETFLARSLSRSVTLSPLINSIVKTFSVVAFQ
jgi:hypothetical protein